MEREVVVYVVGWAVVAYFGKGSTSSGEYPSRRSALLALTEHLKAGAVRVEVSRVERPE